MLKSALALGGAVAALTVPYVSHCFSVVLKQHRMGASIVYIVWAGATSISYKTQAVCLR